LVIESGASTTSVVPVFDGYIVRKAIQKFQIGGNFVSEQVREYLKSTNVDLTPISMVKSKEAVESAQPPVYERKDVQVTQSWEDYAIEVFIIVIGSNQSAILKKLLFMSQNRLITRMN
jgi:actin-related protein